MEWKDLAGVVGKFAPLAGTLIGGPAGAAIGSLIAATLGAEVTPDAIHAAIASDPQAALKLAQWEGDNKVKLQAMMYSHADNIIAADTAAIQADVADRDSARKREVSVRDRTPAVLAAVVVIASVALGASVVSGYVTHDPAQSILVGTVVGYVFSEAKQVLSYYFGSSSSSDRQTEIIAQSPAVIP